MRKKLKVTGLVLAACLLMAGCGQKAADGGKAPETVAKAQSTAAAENKEAEKAAEETEKASEETEEAGASPEESPAEETAWDGVNRAIRLGRDGMYLDSDDTAFVCYGTYDRIVADESHPKLRDALDKYNDDLHLQAQIFLDQFKRIVTESGASGDQDADSFYHTANNAQLMRADEHIVSFIRWDTTYGLGNGDTTLLGVNFDSQTGEMLSLNDLVSDRDGLCDVVVEKVKEIIPREDFPKTPEQTVRELFSQDDLTSTKEFSWSAGYEGMSFLFNTTVNFAYFSRPGGAVEVFIPYREYPDLFTDDVKDIPEKYAADFILADGTAGDAWFDADGDGTLEETVGILNEDEYGGYSGLTLMRGQDSFEFPFEFGSYYIFGTRAHLGEGKDFLCLEEMENDYGWNLVYRLNGTPEYVGQFDGDVEFSRYLVNIDDYEDFEDISDKDRKAYMFTDPEHVMLREPSHLFGSNSVFRENELTDAGVMEPVEGWHDYTSVRTLTAKKKMTADEINEEGEVIGTVDIPKGAKITLVRTDNNSLVDAKTPEGKTIRFEITTNQEEYQQYVGSEKTDDLFDGIIYAD